MDQISQVKVIAKIGRNYRNLEMAKELIRIPVHACKADTPKFQQSHNYELLTSAEYGRPHLVSENSWGDTYGIQRDFLGIYVEQHSWERIFEGEFHVLTGMSISTEITALVRFYEKRAWAHNLVLFRCTSAYPIIVDDICLLEIAKLMYLYDAEVKGMGFSGHHLSIAADVAPLAIARAQETKGAGRFTHIKRHFTELGGLRHLCSVLKKVGLALTESRPRSFPSIKRVPEQDRYVGAK